MTLIVWVACLSSSVQKVESRGPETEVEKAFKMLQDLNATQTEVTGKLIEVRNRLLSMPKDSPPTRELTRQLAILNMRATELVSEVFRAGLEHQAAVLAEQEAKAAQGTTNSSSFLVVQQGNLRLYVSPIQSDAGSGTRSVVGELENGGTNIVSDVTLVFDLYNEKGQVVGVVSDFSASLQVGSRWSYQAMILDEAAVRAEFKSLDWGGKDQGKLPQLPGVKPEPTKP